MGLLCDDRVARALQAMRGSFPVLDVTAKDSAEPSLTSCLRKVGRKNVILVVPEGFVLSHLAGLARWRHLKGLVLVWSGLRDREISALTRFRSLRLLNVEVKLNANAKQVADLAVECIARLRNLRHLSLGFTKWVTDAGLARLTNLRYLNLQRTQVTDPGLAHIARLPNLRWLCLWHTKVTDSGVQRLKKRLPRLDVAR